MCGLPPENCTVVSNPTSVLEMLDPVADAAEKATDLLIVYFAGHGLIHSTGSDLHVTLVDSNRERMYSSVPYSNFRTEIRMSPARRKLVILDCCYSGRALNVMGDEESTGLIANSAALSGVYVMASTAENRTSNSGATYTAFSGELIKIMQSGIPECGEFLDVDSIFGGAQAALQDQGLPLPQKRESDHGASLHLVRNLAHFLPFKEVYGAALGVELGTVFPSRIELHKAGVHRPLQAGICGTAEKGGAESIVVSGGYKDDEDYGDTIIYTGHGGRDPNTGQQVKDQSPEDTGNAALIKSMITGRPVRVVRGSGGNPVFSPNEGYSYDGLFRVTDYSVRPSLDGPSVLLFRLEYIAGQDNKSGALRGKQELSYGRFDRQAPGVYSLRAHAEQLKEIYEYGCQVCEVVLEAPARQRFASVAYIRGLEPPHNGRDALDNMLCLCSNHRDLFRFGAITIEDDFTVLDVDGEEIGDLVVRHPIDLSNIRYHRLHHRL